MPEKLEWVANDWAEPSHQTLLKPDGSVFMSIAAQKEWRSQFIEGEPQATEKQSAALLKAMGAYRFI